MSRNNLTNVYQSAMIVILLTVLLPTSAFAEFNVDTVVSEGSAMWTKLMIFFPSLVGFGIIGTGAFKYWDKVKRGDTEEKVTGYIGWVLTGAGVMAAPWIVIGIFTTIKTVFGLTDTLTAGL